MPSGGVPEGAVPLTCLSAGGVPDGNAVSAVPDAAFSDAAGVCTAGLDVAVLPESDVQPATNIPAMRIADATSMMMVLLFIGYISLMSRGSPFDLLGGSSGIREDTVTLIFTTYRE
jgi:hypothetical protein